MSRYDTGLIVPNLERTVLLLLHLPGLVKVDGNDFPLNAVQPHATAFKASKHNFCNFRVMRKCLRGLLLRLPQWPLELPCHHIINPTKMAFLSALQPGNQVFLISAATVSLKGVFVKT